MNLRVGIVIVTRNHERTIESVLDSIVRQSLRPERTIIVDCDSRDRAWVERWRGREGLEIVLLGHNAGFSGGNNEGWRRLGWTDGCVLFLNPDVIMPADLIARIVTSVRDGVLRDVAAWGVRLMRWDFERSCSNGQIDSTGIFPALTGWKDRRETSPPAADRAEPVPALCGAFFMARVRDLQAVALRDGVLWDERYLAYKEDVELSLRLRRSGRSIAIWHGAMAWHGRGWPARRSAVPQELRLLAARNELLLHREYCPWRAPISLLKIAAVRWLDL